MNRKIGEKSSLLTLVSVILFAIFMLLDMSSFAYGICIILAIGFLLMTASFASFTTKDKEVAKYISLIFATIYAVFIMLVYYAQITSLVNDNLSNQAIDILDYQSFGLFFNYNLFGYGMLSISTFFIGLTIEPENIQDKILKYLLEIHGIFSVVCLIPLLNIFNQDMANSQFIGIFVLVIWCLYFAPICYLSIGHFKRKPDK